MKKSIGYGRGSVYTIILKALQSGDKYGYEICKEIEEKSKGAYILKQPSLYSGLKRLEAQKDVYSYWGDSDIGGRRHYYSLTEKGKERINRTNFSWEDARADVLGDLFELSDDEKTLKNIKNDVNNVTNDINEINNINNQIDKQIQKNEITDSLIFEANKNSENVLNNSSQSKIERHLVNENQQDLFSLFTAPLVQENTEENEVKETKLEDVKSFDNQDNKPLLEDLKETLNDNNEEEKTLINSQEQDVTFSQKEEVYNENIVNDITNFDDKNYNEKESDELKNQKDDRLEKIDEGSQNEVKKIIKTEASAINVQDYLNSRTTSTLFDEEIKRAPVKVQAPITEENEVNNSSNTISDDEMDKRYQDFLKAFEVNDEEKTKDETKVITENKENTENNLNVSSNTLNNVISSNVNQENVINSSASQDNQVQNDSSGVTFYNMSDTNQSSLKNEQINNSENNENLVFNEDFEVIGSKETNNYTSNENLFVSNNEQENTSNLVQNIINDEPNNELNNLTTNSPTEKPYSVEVKKIFGDLIEDSLEVSDQEISDLKNSILAENSEKNEFASNETKEIFEDYNKTNFKANDDLPRVNISNNINLSLNKDDYKQETKVYKSPFKSYHDDAPSSDDYYDQMYEKAYKDRFENNEKYRSLNYNDNQEKTEQNTVNNYNNNNYDNNNYSQNYTFDDVPFDKKFEQSQKESYLSAEDYVVRRYNNKNVKDLESRYLNVSKFNNINNLVKILFMFFSTLIMNFIAFKFAFVTKLQQNILTCEYCLTLVYAIISFSYFLLHKNQRKIVNNFNKQLLKVILDVITLTLVVLLNIFVLKMENNLINYYATLIIPTIILSMFIIIDLVMIKIKKSSFLYK